MCLWNINGSRHRSYPNRRPSATLPSLPVSFHVKRTAQLKSVVITDPSLSATTDRVSANRPSTNHHHTFVGWLVFPLKKTTFELCTWQIAAAAADRKTSCCSLLPIRSIGMFFHSIVSLVLPERERESETMCAPWKTIRKTFSMTPHWLKILSLGVREEE